MKERRDPVAETAKTVGIEKLTALMERLRSPGGCPWDREQDLESLTPFIIEEAYEVVDAIESGDAGSVKDELGDLLFQIIFACRIVTEGGGFGLAEVIDNTVEKMIRRHPHVYGDTRADTAGEVLKNWEEIKGRERSAAGDASAASNRSALSDVPSSMPSLMRAAKISKRAAKTGFDWKNLDHVLEKVAEELGEFARAVRAGLAEETEEELGDILFTLVNVARFVEVNPEMALKKAIGKFIRRFHKVEHLIEAEGGDLGSTTTEELERLWDTAKLSEKKL